MREWLAASDDPSLSRHARLREVEDARRRPDVPCALGAGRPGDAVGPNMMTRNAYALNMGYVMQRAPVKPERADLEANMGGDKKPSYEYFHVGSREDRDRRGVRPRRPDRARAAHDRADLEALSWAGTHGAVASGMQSVAFTPAYGDRRGVRGDRPGPGHGRHLVDGARHRAAGRGRAAGVDPLPRARGRHRRRRDHPPLRAGLARARSAAPARARSTASRRSSRRRRSASRSARRRRWRPPAARTSSRPTTSAAA